MAGGYILLRIRLNNVEEAERWVLSFGTHATVVRPEALRERFGKIGKEFGEKYGGS